jgi:hypothetical protein
MARHGSMGQLQRLIPFSLPLSFSDQGQKSIALLLHGQKQALVRVRGARERVRWEQQPMPRTRRHRRLR